jgi:hypothetical protein
MTKEPIKINNLETLQREKQRLSLYCKFQEKLLEDKFTIIRQNYKQVIGEEFLPYTLEKNRKVSGLLDWINEFIFDKLLGINPEDKHKLPEILIKLTQILVIRAFDAFAKG